jgi:hypothetical protein
LEIEYLSQGVAIEMEYTRPSAWGLCVNGDIADKMNDNRNKCEKINQSVKDKTGDASMPRSGNIIQPNGNTLG